MRTDIAITGNEKMVNRVLRNDGMIRGMKDFFKDYKGCRNCKHQPAPLTMCDYGKRKTYVELICSGWEPKDGEQNDIR